MKSTNKRYSIIIDVIINSIAMAFIAHMWFTKCTQTTLSITTKITNDLVGSF